MEALIPLALLACPIGMGLMMWFMAKGMRGQASEQKSEQPGQPELAELKAEQARLGAEIDRLERGGDAREERVGSGVRERG